MVVHKVWLITYFNIAYNKSKKNISSYIIQDFYLTIM